MAHKLKSETTAAFQSPRPGPTTIHHHDKQWPAIILVGFLCLLLTLPVVWYILVFLYDKMGAGDPERAAASTLIFTLVGLPFLYFMGWLVSLVIGRILDRTYEYKLEARAFDLKMQRLAVTALQQPQPAQAQRLTKEQAKLRALLLTVMAEAYRFEAEHNRPYKRSEPKPWSRAQVLNQKLLSFDNETPSWALAAQVRPWLIEHNVIVGDAVSAEYPTMAHFEALVEEVFHLPVQVTIPQLPYPTPNGYNHR